MQVILNVNVILLLFGLSAIWAGKMCVVITPLAILDCSLVTSPLFCLFFWIRAKSKQPIILLSIYLSTNTRTWLKASWETISHSSFFYLFSCPISSDLIGKRNAMWRCLKRESIYTTFVWMLIMLIKIWGTTTYF